MIVNRRSLGLSLCRLLDAQGLIALRMEIYTMYEASFSGFSTLHQPGLDSHRVRSCHHPFFGVVVGLFVGFLHVQNYREYVFHTSPFAKLGKG